MEKNKNKGRGRPKKDFGELKEKINQESIENKGKFKRGRPRKNQTTNTIEQQPLVSDFSYKTIEIDTDNSNINSNSQKAENLSKKFLYCCIIFFLISVGIFCIQKLKEKNKNDLESSEINDNNEISSEIQNDESISLEIGYSNEDGEFIGLEELDTQEPIEDNTNITKNDDENMAMIRTFYENINNQDFDSMRALTDKYLKNNDSFKTYYSSSRLTNFLSKLLNNQIYLTNIKEVQHEKENVQRYIYDIKYVLNSNQKLYQEQWQIDIVNRNGEHLIGSIMCITTGCSRMPFFQK